MNLPSNLWLHALTFSSLNDVFLNILCVSKRMRAMLLQSKDANIQLWMPLTDYAAFRYNYTKALSSAYRERQLQFTVSWYRECRTIWKHLVARDYMTSYKASSLMYLYVAPTTLVYENIKHSAAKWYHARRSTLHKNAWIITNSSNRLVFIYYHDSEAYLKNTDFEQLVFGFTQEYRHWLFEYQTFSPLCARCDICLSPTSFSTTCAMCTID